MVWELDLRQYPKSNASHAHTFVRHFGRDDPLFAVHRQLDNVTTNTPRVSLSSGRQYSVVMFDVDCKDPSLGMSCPPAPFVEPQLLSDVRDCLLEDGEW